MHAADQVRARDVVRGAVHGAGCVLGRDSMQQQSMHGDLLRPGLVPPADEVQQRMRMRRHLHRRGFVRGGIRVPGHDVPDRERLYVADRRL